MPNKRKAKKRRIYLDHAATTPIDSRVIRLVAQVMSDVYGNPASLHVEGRAAKKALEDARSSVARLLSARASEIVFTSGGTEANNLALLGIIESWITAHPGEKPHLITSTIEHSSILEVAKHLESRGVEVTYIKPTEDGLIDSRSVRDALRPNTVLVSIMYANNEIGTIQPIREIAKVIRRFRTDNNQSLPYFHTDAAQAAGYLSLDTTKLGVDFITIDGAKIYGPKGVGALYARRGEELSPQIIGGGQESGLRSGTENVALIAGFARSLELCESMKARETLRLTMLRDYFVKKILEIPGTSINGTVSERLPNNISVCIKGLDAEFAVYQLDERGIAVSSASTCMSLKEDSYSYVVEEIGRRECKSSSLRFSLGRRTSKSDINICIKALKEVLLIQRGALN